MREQLSSPFGMQIFEAAEEEPDGVGSDRRSPRVFLPVASMANLEIPPQRRERIGSLPDNPSGISAAVQADRFPQQAQRRRDDEALALLSRQISGQGLELSLLEECAADSEAVGDEVERFGDELEEQGEDNGNGRHDAIVVDLSRKRPHLHDIIEKYGIVVVGGVLGHYRLEVLLKDGELCFPVAVAGYGFVEELLERLES